MLRKIVFTACLTIVLVAQTNGQWYEKKYNVTDINYLTRDQLDKSLKESRTSLMYSGIVTCTGAVLFLAGRYLPYELDDNSSFLEQLIGENGMKKIMMATGVATFTGGAIAGIVYLARIGKINSVINQNYSLNGNIQILPVMIVNSSDYSLSPGISITYYF